MVLPRYVGKKEQAPVFHGATRSPQNLSAYHADTCPLYVLRDWRPPLDVAHGGGVVGLRVSSNSPLLLRGYSHYWAPGHASPALRHASQKNAGLSATEVQAAGPPPTPPTLSVSLLGLPVTLCDLVIRNRVGFAFSEGITPYQSAGCDPD